MNAISRARQYAKANADAALPALELAAAGEPGYEPDSLAVQVATAELRKWEQQTKPSETGSNDCV